MFYRKDSVTGRAILSNLFFFCDCLICVVRHAVRKTQEGRRKTGVYIFFPLSAPREFVPRFDLENDECYGFFLYYY